jgi:hypothetical protein
MADDSRLSSYHVRLGVTFPDWAAVVCDKAQVRLLAKLCPSEPGLSTAEMRLRPDVRARFERCSHPPRARAPRCP